MICFNRLFVEKLTKWSFLPDFFFRYLVVFTRFFRFLCDDYFTLVAPFHGQKLLSILYFTEGQFLNLRREHFLTLSQICCVEFAGNCVFEPVTSPTGFQLSSLFILKLVCFLVFFLMGDGRVLCLFCLFCLFWLEVKYNQTEQQTSYRTLDKGVI